ncbi:MAG: hypothetical protein ACYC1M_01725 [Armatimonadota bacterium]
MISSKLWVRTAIFITFLCTMTSAILHATVNINGRIEVWNPINNTYEPMKQIRVRVVLAEDFDADTRDVEATTNDDGYFSASKGNPWWRDGYQAYLIVFAEVPNKLEIQSHYMQVDGYQAFGRGFYAPQDRSTTSNIKIGGSQANVDTYRVGGIALLGNSDGANAVTGQRAFFLCQEMTDHRRALMAMAASDNDFEEKEVSFPLGVPVANYMPIDYIRYPDLYFRNNIEASKVARHELSHGIMADVYGSLNWPGLTHYLTDGLNSTHFAAMRNPVPEWAWVEGWADFLGEYTTARRYGRNFQDYETQNADWRRRLVEPAQDRWNVEGEISAALWDIADGTGFEKRLNQDPSIPGDEQFYDGMADTNLSRVWTIFKRHSPDMFVHDDDGGDDNHSFISHWLQEWPSDKYVLKSILYNRGIFMGQAPETPPTVSLDPPTIDGNIARVRCRITEADPEDRDNIWVQVFVNGMSRERFRLAEAWSGDSSEYTYEHTNLLLSASGRTPAPPSIMVAVDDGMLSASATCSLDRQPDATTVSGLEIYLLSVRIHNAERSMAILSAANEMRLVFQQGKAGPEMTVPQEGRWKVPVVGEFVYDTPVLLASIADTSSVSFTLGIEGASGSKEKLSKELQSLGSIRQSFTEADDMGIGEHKVSIPMPGDFSADVVYSITPPANNLLPVSLSGINLVQARNRAPIVSLVELTKEQRVMLAEPKKQRPAATLLLDKSSSVLSRYARLQSDILECEQDIESKMGRQNADSKLKSEKVSAQETIKFTPKLRSLKPVLRSDVAIIDLPSVIFLDQNHRAGGLIDAVPAKGQARLQEMQQNLIDLQKEMDVLRGEAQQLREAMVIEVENLSTPDKVDNAAREGLQVKLQDMIKRIDEMLPSIDAWVPIITKQSDMVQYGLTLPVNGDPVIGEPVVDVIQPDEKQPNTKPRKKPLKGDDPIDILPDVRKIKE